MRKDCPMIMRYSKMYKHVKNLFVIEFNVLKFIQKVIKLAFIVIMKIMLVIMEKSLKFQKKIQRSIIILLLKKMVW